MARRKLTDVEAGQPGLPLKKTKKQDGWLTVGHVELSAPRLMITLTPTKATASHLLAGAIVRADFPQGVTDETRAMLDRAAPAALKILPSRAGIVAVDDKTEPMAEDEVSLRDAVLEVAGKVSTTSREKLLALCDQTMGEVKL